ncbi:MAG: EpsG family protein [Hyphomicrobiales bacterium]|nr:EpsG family protein [Hyphomicrobiales bacterium]
MLPYWFLFLVPAFAALSERSSGLLRRPFAVSWLLIWSLFTILIGLRYQVGGDWGGYERIFRYSSYLTFDEVLLRGDPGYIFLNWLAAKAGYDIALVNLFCAAVFTSGLVVFAREQPRPWLAIAVAVPYLVTVVAMGYSRQGVAIGFAMLALAGLGANSTIRFVIWIAIAALFHKTAVLLIPIAVLAATKRRIWTFIWVGCFALLLYYNLLAESVDNLIENYIVAGYQSQGAAIRVAMNALPAAVFLLYRRHFKLEGAQLNLWTYLSLGALGFIVLLIVSPSSTAVDRVALYLIPVQIFVLSRLPLAWQDRYGAGEIVKFGVIAYSALVLFVWLNFAQHAQYWLPYQMTPFSD